MTTLTIWIFPDADIVRRAERDLGDLSAQGSITIHDGALLAWPENRTNPLVRQLQDLALTAVVDASFWGMLIGTVLFAPTLGSLAGSETHSLDNALSGVGVTAELVHQIRAQLRPATSAVLTLTETAAQLHAADDALAAYRASILRAELSDDDRPLRAIFVP